MHHGEYCTRLSKQLLSLSACHLLFITRDNNLPHILWEDRIWLFWKGGEKSTLHYPQPRSICNVTSVSTISNILSLLWPRKNYLGSFLVFFFVLAAISSLFLHFRHSEVLIWSVALQLQICLNSVWWLQGLWWSSCTEGKGERQLSAAGWIKYGQILFMSFDSSWLSAV